MNKKVHRLLAGVVAFVLLLVLFTGCGSQNKTEGSKDQGINEQKSTKQESASDSKSSEKKPIVLTYFWDMDPKATMSMKSYGEIAFFKEFEKRTGINIEWRHPPSGQANEQFNLMLASQDLPDLIQWNWRTVPGGPGKAIQDGSIIKLNDLVDKNAPNLKKVLEEHPDWKKEAVLDDGTLYMFPFIRGDKQLRLSSAFQTRKDWLERVGLDVPKTIDDWYKVLKAYKEKDANGNGDPNDEIPFTSIGLTWNSIRNFAMAWGVRDTFYMGNGKVQFGPIQPAYKDFLTTMAKWYKEGLIDQDYAATDGKSFEAKITGSKAGSYFGMVSGYMGRFTQLMRPKDPNFRLVGVPFPIGPAGKSYGTLDPSVQSGGTAISAKCKYLKEAAEFLDYAYGQDGHMLVNFGIEGESYTMENGEPKYTDKILKDPNLPVPNALIRYAMSISGGPFVQDVRYFWQILTYPEQQEAVKTWIGSSDPSLLLPPITPTAEESQRMASIMTEVTTYVDEMFNKFVMGQEPIENFDKYVESIKKMGIDEATKIQQAALERFNSRK